MAELVSLIVATLLFILLKDDAVMKHSAPRGKQCIINKALVICKRQQSGQTFN